MREVGFKYTYICSDGKVNLYGNPYGGYKTIDCQTHATMPVTPEVATLIKVNSRRKWKQKSEPIILTRADGTTEKYVNIHHAAQMLHTTTSALKVCLKYGTFKGNSIKYA